MIGRGPEESGTPRRHSCTVPALGKTAGSIQPSTEGPTSKRVTTSTPTRTTTTTPCGTPGQQGQRRRRRPEGLDGLDTFPQDPKSSNDTVGDSVVDAGRRALRRPKQVKDQPGHGERASSAQDCLDLTAFSELAVIDQRSTEYGSGNEIEKIRHRGRFAPRGLSAASVKPARDYLDLTSFSRQGLRISCRVRKALSSPSKRRLV